VSAKFSTWLFTITRNLCLNEFRRRARLPAESRDQTLSVGDEQPGHQVEEKGVASPPQQLLHDELEEKILEVLAALPENQRTALLLCRQEDLSYEKSPQCWIVRCPPRNP
jgi:RNA polymerase sigma-70 factor (ECF subfamily)